MTTANQLEPPQQQYEQLQHVNFLAISRHFLSWLNTWQDEGFKPVHQAWIERIVDKISVNDACDNIDGNWVGLDESGLGLFKSNKKHFSLSLEDVNLKQ